MSRLHPGSAKPVVALPLIVLTVAIFAIAPCCFLFIDKSYTAFSTKYAIEQSAKAYKENRFNEAATILERLTVTHKLADDERALLNDIYLARADWHAQQQNYTAGLADLAKISPGYGKFLLVNQKQHEFGELLKTQSIAGTTKMHRSDAAASRRVLSASATRATKMRRSMDAPNLSTCALTNSVQRTEPMRHTAQMAKPTWTKAPITSAAPTHHWTDAVNGTAQAPQAAVAAAPTRRSSDVSTPAPQAATGAHRRKYAESEVVRYNELLAAYFSQDRKAASKPAEPPSLKEWIDLGKPSF